MSLVDQVSVPLLYDCLPIPSFLCTEGTQFPVNGQVYTIDKCCSDKPKCNSPPTVGDIIGDIIGGGSSDAKMMCASVTTVVFSIALAHLQ